MPDVVLARGVPPVLLLGAGTLTLAACGDATPSEPEPAEPEVTQIEVDPPADTLFALDDTVRLTAMARDPSGEVVADASFEWSSSDTDVVVVGDDGLATAVGNGLATITAVAQDAEAAAELAVAQRAAAVEVTPSSTVLTTVGETHQFTAAAMDANDNELTDVAWVWQSENHAVATVDSTGLVHARGNGAATITATAQDVPGHGVVTVEQDGATLRFRTEPSDTIAGDPIDPGVQVEVLDDAGNRVEDSALPITLELADPQAPGTLHGTRTVSATAGVATFSGLTVDRVGTHALQASGTGVEAATSASFEITPADPAGLSFQTQAADATAGSTLAPAVEVRVEDRFGNLVPTATHTVTLKLGGDSGDALQGTTTHDAVDGVATFADLTVLRAAEGHSLVAESDGLDAAPGAPFEVVPADPAQLAFQTQPSHVEGHEWMSPAVAVEVQDAFGNRVPSVTTDVTLALGVTPDAGPDPGLDGRLTTAVTEGVAVFDSVRIERPFDSYTLTASAPDLDPAESAAFPVTLTFTDVNVGGAHTCAVTEGGEIYCWGDNSHGQLGHPAVDSTSVPVRVQARYNFGTVSVGGDHTCATLRAIVAQEPLCWGRNDSGQLGVGDRNPREVPTTVDGPSMTETSAGYLHTCGIGSEGVYCWGDNTTAQIGEDPTVTPRRSTPGLVTSIAARDVSAGFGHSCAVDTDGIAYCWGGNTAGELGNGTTSSHESSPVTVENFSGVLFETISAESVHTCATDVTDFVAWCWGSNVSGQLGTGDTDPALTPSTTDGPYIRQVSAGEGYTCGVSQSAEALCWGRNGAHLGLGDSGDAVTSPSAVRSTEAFTKVTSGWGSDPVHTCGLTTDGAVYCWGSGRQGQLGNGAWANRFTPTPVTQ